MPAISVFYGCDSTYTLNLTVHPVHTFTEDAAICDGDSYSWRGNYYYSSGTYYDYVYTMIATCYDTYVLNLTVNPTYTFTDNHTMCDGANYLWQGNYYSSEGTYYANYLTVNGCDSNYVLNLSTNPVYTIIDNESICEGSSYQWHGGSYNSTGTYHADYLSVNGCDSTFTLNLIVNPVYTITDNESICEGGSYSWHGHAYNSTGTYHANYLTVHGCDSIYTLNLIVKPAYSFTDYESICNGGKLSVAWATLILLQEHTMHIIQLH